MNYFRKKQMTFWGIVLLVVMNLSSLATVWWQQHLRPWPPPGGGDNFKRIRHFLQEELTLTESQVEQFAQLQQKHFERTRAVHESMRNLRTEFFGELSAVSPDEMKMERLATEIGRNQAELEKMTFRHFLDLKNLCTPEQQENLNALFKELLVRMVPPPKPPPNARMKPRPPERQH